MFIDMLWSLGTLRTGVTFPGTRELFPVHRSNMIMSQYNMTESPKQHHRVVELYAKFKLRKTRLLLGRHTVEFKKQLVRKNNFSKKILPKIFFLSLSIKLPLSISLVMLPRLQLAKLNKMKTLLGHIFFSEQHEHVATA